MNTLIHVCFAVLLSVDYSIAAKLVDRIMLRIQDYSDQLATITDQLATSTALNQNYSQQLATTTTQLAISTALTTQLQVKACLVFICNGFQEISSQPGVVAT